MESGEKRLHFAREHKNQTLEQRKIMWSDESRVTGGQKEMRSCTQLCFRGNKTSTLNPTEKVWDVLEKPVIQHFSFQTVKLVFFIIFYFHTIIRINLKYDYNEVFRCVSQTQR